MPPIGAYNFHVRLIGGTGSGFAQAGLAALLGGGFSECHGLESTMQVEEYREGGRNDGVLKFPGRVASANVRLKRGIAISDELWTWHEDYLRGHGKRRDGVIELLDDERAVVGSWEFRRGIPIRWIGPTLIAGQSAVAVEELEIAHEGLRPRSASTLEQVGEAFGALGLGRL